MEHQHEQIAAVDDEILKLEFERVYSLFEQSEDFGEKRTALMITVTGFLFAGFFSLLKDDLNYFFEHPFIFWLLIIANIFIIVFGILTLVRMAHRNLTTDEYKDAIRLIKQFYTQKSPTLKQYLYFSAESKRANRRNHPFRGGYIEITKLINCVLCGLFIYMVISYYVYAPAAVTSRISQTLIFSFSLLISVLSWFFQKIITNKIYDQGFADYQARLNKLSDHE